MSLNSPNFFKLFFFLLWFSVLFFILSSKSLIWSSALPDLLFILSSVFSGIVFFIYDWFFLWFLCLFRIFYVFTFRERRKEGEREGEKHQCVAASHAPPTGGVAHNPGMCPDCESNWWPIGLHASTLSTEPHQPGLYALFHVFEYLYNHSFKLYTW